MPFTGSQPIYVSFAAVLILASLPILGMSAWFFYDGAIAYPEKQRQQLAYQQLASQHPPADVPRLWAAMTAANGWPPETPEAPLSDMSIFTQYLLGSWCALVGVVGLLGPAAVLLMAGLRRRPAGAAAT